MSSFAFGALSAPTGPPAGVGVAAAADTPAATTKLGKYVTVVAALVPAEVLAAHAAIVAAAITVDDKATPPTKTLDKPALQFAFWGLIVVSVLLYVAGRYSAARAANPQAPSIGWNRWDILKAAIAPCAFVAWTMLQKDTAFDAVAPNASEALRNSIAIVVAVGLTAIAAALGVKAAGAGGTTEGG